MQMMKKDLTERERKLVMSIAKLSRPGILRVLAAAGSIVDGNAPAENFIGIPGCMGAAARGPDGCTCRVRCCVPATDELASRWWGHADNDDAQDELEQLKRSQARARKRELATRKRVAKAEAERAEAIASGRLVITDRF